MELPIVLALDTTEGWENGDTVLGRSELAIEIAGKKADGSLIKYLMIGDEKASGPNATRLRVTPRLIAGLQETLDTLALGDRQLLQTIAQTELKLQTNMNQNINLLDRRLQEKIVNQPTYHDDTLKGTGIEKDPLSVNINFDLTVAGIVASAEMIADGETRTFELPSNFVFVRIIIVQVNGLGQKPGADYSLDLLNRTITFTEMPEENDTITIYYTSNN